MTKAILTFNAGSSSLKFALFSTDREPELLYQGEVEAINETPSLRIKNPAGTVIDRQNNLEKGHEAALVTLLDWLDRLPDSLTLVAAGHRVVHGGTLATKPMLITPDVLEALERLTPLAPLHQPHNLSIIRYVAKAMPALPQIACFDTAFHRTQKPETDLFALPLSYRDEGIIRYGFHGLSYESIAARLPAIAGEKAEGRFIIAHLGNGASLSALKNRQSLGSTMGFTALDGLIMGTRCGSLDPGVILYLLQEKAMSPAAISTLLYKDSGLKGISGISNDMRDLLASDAPSARLAVSLFCTQAARQIAGMIPLLGGLDGLVFTAGIGQSAGLVRRYICDGLSWLGLKLNEEANRANALTIHEQDSQIAVYVIPTNEELVIARACYVLAGLGNRL